MKYWTLEELNEATGGVESGGNSGPVGAPVGVDPVGTIQGKSNSS